MVGRLFDHLNNADRILLTLGALIAEKHLIAAISEGPSMLQYVEFKQFLQSYNERAAAVESFVRLVKPDIKVTVSPMFTPFGPACENKDIECLILDQEDMEMASSVNTVRGEQGWEMADLLSIDLAYYPEGKPDEAEIESQRYLYEDSLYGADDVHLRPKPVITIDSVDIRANKASTWVSPRRLADYA